MVSGPDRISYITFTELEWFLQEVLLSIKDLSNCAALPIEEMQKAKRDIASINQEKHLPGRIAIEPE